MPLWQSFSPVDVLVVGAVNDVLRGKNATKIIRDLGNFKNDVLSMKIRSGAGGRVTFSVVPPPSAEGYSSPIRRTNFARHQVRNLSTLTSIL